MKNIIFHSSKFEFKGIPIPELKIESGKLIRLCMPNFDSNGIFRKFKYYENKNHIN
jgi:hypothetical protein